MFSRSLASPQQLGPREAGYSPPMQQAHDACKERVLEAFKPPVLPGPQSVRQASPEQYCASSRRKRAPGPETAIQKAAAQRTQTAGTASQASRPLGTRHVRRHSGRLPPIACYAGLLLCSTRTRTKGSRVPPLSLPDKKKKRTPRQDYSLFPVKGKGKQTSASFCRFAYMDNPPDY